MPHPRAPGDRTRPGLLMDPFQQNVLHFMRQDLLHPISTHRVMPFGLPEERLQMLEAGLAPSREAGGPTFRARDARPDPAQS